MKQLMKIMFMQGFMGLDFQLSVDYCFKLMNKLNIHAYHICGHSLGGMIALLMKLEHPKKIESIVLLDSFVDFKERFTNGYDLLFRMDNFPGSPSILLENCVLKYALNCLHSLKVKIQNNVE